MRRFLVGLAVVVLLALAWMFRYERLEDSTDHSVVVLWDRWLHRPCLLYAVTERMACATGDAYLDAALRLDAQNPQK